MYTNNRLGIKAIRRRSAFRAGGLKVRAFTLIELLVVIAIISLLVSILLPTLNKAKDLVKETVCMTNLRGIGIAGQLYAEDHDGQMMGGANGAMAENGNYLNPWFQQMALAEYIPGVA